MSLLDELRKARAGQIQLPQVTGQTQQAQQLLTARTTGKALPTAAAPVSAIGEQVAVAEERAKLQEEVLPEIATREEALGAQQLATETQAGEARAQIAQQRRFDDINNRLKLRSLMTELQRNKDQVSLDRNRAQLEQVAFLASMQDKQYIQELTEVGRRRRLDDKVSQLNELQDIMFGESIQAIRSKVGRDNILMANRRDYERALADLSVKDAIDIAAIEARARAQSQGISLEGIRRQAATSAAQAATAGRWQGYSGILSGGLQAYDVMERRREREAEKASQVDEVEQGFEEG